MQMLRDPAHIFHQRCRIPENTLINTLQNEADFAGLLRGFDDERVVDVAAAEAFRGCEFASQFELESNVLQISDRAPPRSTTVTGTRLRRAIS